MDVLVVNAGSTSLKLHLVRGGDSEPVDGFVPADAVGHRVVHGGRRFEAATLVDDDVERAIQGLAVLAPLHNRRALDGSGAPARRSPTFRTWPSSTRRSTGRCRRRRRRTPMPERWREEWGVRRYGFHGISVQWVASQVRVPRLVVCHLGGGSSVTAVRDGRSVDTTMGFSPLEGVPMTTRSGSVDPGALVYLLREGLPRRGRARARSSSTSRGSPGSPAAAPATYARRLPSRSTCSSTGSRRRWRRWRRRAAASTRSRSPAGSASTPTACESGSSSGSASSATSASRSCRRARSS